MNIGLVHPLACSDKPMQNESDFPLYGRKSISYFRTEKAFHRQAHLIVYCTLKDASVKNCALIVVATKSNNKMPRSCESISHDCKGGAFFLFFFYTERNTTAPIWDNRNQRFIGSLIAQYSSTVNIKAQVLGKALLTSLSTR